MSQISQCFLAEFPLKISASCIMGSCRQAADSTRSLIWHERRNFSSLGPCSTPKLGFQSVISSYLSDMFSQKISDVPKHGSRCSPVCPGVSQATSFASPAQRPKSAAPEGTRAPSFAAHYMEISNVFQRHGGYPKSSNVMGVTPKPWWLGNLPFQEPLRFKPILGM